MPSFLTQCPHCLTSFRVTDAQLEAAEGLVRCGACLGIFSAASNRITLKQSPDELSASEAATEVDALDCDDEVSDEREADSPGSKFVPELADDDAFYEALDETRDEDVVQEGSTEQDFDGSDLDLEADEDLEEAEENSNPLDIPAGDRPDPEDFDIPLGDFNLGGHLEPGEEDEHEEFEVDDEEDEEDEEDDSSFDEDEIEADEPDETESVYEEYADEVRSELLVDAEEEEHQPEEFEPEFDNDDEEVFEAADDKAELRRYLAGIEDDDALGTIDDDAALAAIDEPVMLDTAPRRSWIAGLALLTGNLVLVALLLLQYADANVDTLSRNARLAGLMPYACRLLECPAPDRSQLELFVTEQLLVRSHPRFAQALEVNLVFRNDATVAQPFPALELGFSDAGNRLLANRLFAPSEYLPPELRTSDMPAQSSMQLSLELLDPGSEAVNYTLDFRKTE